MIQVKNSELKIPKELQQQSTVINESQKMGKDEFMKLLLAEMSNQDPLDPKSNSESIAQMAHFAALEHSENCNRTMTDYATNQRLNGLTSSAHMIGKYIQAENGNDTIIGKVKSTVIQEGKVYAKIEDEEGNETKISLDQIVALSADKIAKKEYKKLSPAPEAEEVTAEQAV
jgi:flagellar basal-body rod modification protein FlgD